MSKILIIEDSSFQRKMLKRIVEELGHSAILAEDGDEGLRFLKENNPDCIFLDLLMPGKTGFNVLEELSKYEMKPPVVVISSDIQESSKKSCFDLGAKAFLYKPPKKEEIASILNEIVS